MWSNRHEKTMLRKDVSRDLPTKEFQISGALSWLFYTSRLVIVGISKRLRKRDCSIVPVF